MKWLSCPRCGGALKVSEDELVKQSWVRSYATSGASTLGLALATIGWLALLGTLAAAMGEGRNSAGPSIAGLVFAFGMIITGNLSREIYFAKPPKADEDGVSS